MSLAAPFPTLPSQANTVTANKARVASGRVTWSRTLLALLFRTAAFAVVQGAIALLFALQGNPAPWQASIAYWPVSAMLAGLANLYLLIVLTRHEGLRYSDLLAFNRATIGRDLLVVAGLTLLAGPVAMVPMMGLSTLLFGDAQAASSLFILPLPPLLAAASVVLLPLSIALVELPTYFGYAMPRLEALSGRAWLAVGLSSLLLGLQHATLPLIVDGRFILYRAAMFLPFAVLLGLALHWRPRLMPYLMVVHFLIDLATAWFIWVVSTA